MTRISYIMIDINCTYRNIEIFSAGDRRQTLHRVREGN
jgi:hypothetical protein